VVTNQDLAVERTESGPHTDVRFVFDSPGVEAVDSNTDSLVSPHGELHLGSRGGGSRFRLGDGGRSLFSRSLFSGSLFSGSLFSGSLFSGSLRLAATVVGASTFFGVFGIAAVLFCDSGSEDQQQT
jgi:hypothetical protein